MEILAISVEFLRRLAQKAGPYLLIEAVLPGGTLLAMLLFWYRTRKSAQAMTKPLERASASSFP